MTTIRFFLLIVAVCFILYVLYLGYTTLSAEAIRVYWLTFLTVYMFSTIESLLKKI